MNEAWFQQRVDRAVLGRVISVFMLSSFGLMPLSMAAAGAAVILVSAFGALQKSVREIE